MCTCSKLHWARGLLLHTSRRDGPRGHHTLCRVARVEQSRSPIQPCNSSTGRNHAVPSLVKVVICAFSLDRRGQAVVIALVSGGQHHQSAAGLGLEIEHCWCWD